MSSVDPDIIEKIQAHFHEVIRSRAGNLVDKHELQLPILEYSNDNLEQGRSKSTYFAIPGMYGGFSYWFEKDGEEGIKLVTESWCRVVGGSGQRHEITSEGYKLVDEGFV